MKIVIIGETALAVASAKMLVENDHSVVLVVEDREQAEELSDTLDCAVVHGNGAKPAIIKELNPEKLDVVFALSGSDQDNIIAALIGRSLGAKRVIPKINDPEFCPICRELDLEDFIVPNETISHHLKNIAESGAHLDLAANIRGGANIVTIRPEIDEHISVDELDLPDGAALVCIIRGDEVILRDIADEIRKGDELTIIAREDCLPALKKRNWFSNNND